MSLHFRLATPEDDASLCRVFAGTPMEGGMRLAFEREPSFYGALSIQGPEVQVMVGEDTVTGDIATVGTRTIAPCFLNGAVRSVGYLSDLRVLPAYRGGYALARGWKFFRELDADGRADIYHTAIFAENSAAKSVLAAGRRSVPHYHPCGSFITAGIHPRRGASAPLPRGMKLARGGEAALPSIVDFLNARHACRQFAPVHRMEDFAPGGRWRGLSASDFFLMQEGGDLRAVAALWDQSGFKQTRVLGYGGKWRWLFYLSRLLHRVAPVPCLPRPGGRLRYGYVSFLAVKEDAPALALPLLHAMRAEAARRDWLHGLLSLHEADPLFPVLSHLPHTPFAASLYTLDPRGRAPGLRPDLVPHVEAALL